MDQKKNLNLIHEIIANTIYENHDIPSKYKELANLSNEIYILGALITQKSNQDEIWDELEKNKYLAFLYVQCLNEYLKENSLKLSQIQSLLSQ